MYRYWMWRRNFSRKIKRLGGNVTGIDISKKTIKVAIDHAKSKLDIIMSVIQHPAF